MRDTPSKLVPKQNNHGFGNTKPDAMAAKGRVDLLQK
jgi:hypothetical protein